MTKPSPTPAAVAPDALTAAKHRYRVAVLRATMKAVNAKTTRQLIDVIHATFHAKRRVTITETMQGVIRGMTVADGATAADIAKTLDISIPTVNAQRRKLGLTKKRKKPLDNPVNPLMMMGVEDGIGGQHP
jgi:FixJ family two-component response regulator